jgi:hypothetical protein
MLHCDLTCTQRLASVAQRKQLQRFQLVPLNCIRDMALRLAGAAAEPALPCFGCGVGAGAAAGGTKHLLRHGVVLRLPGANK